MNCPVALFAYKRPKHLRKVVDSLRANLEAPYTELFIFCDAAARQRDLKEVAEVREYARSVEGFKSVTVIERDKNYGLSRSITEGVSWLCQEFGRAAIIEDDVLVSPHFLYWVNTALDKYEKNERVLSVGCFVYPTETKLPETFFISKPDCWGWAVWARSWKNYQSDGLSLLRALHERNLEYRFDFDGAYPFTEMLRDQTKGKNDSWAVRWCASVLLSDGLTIYPNQSMTSNIGFDGTGTHCGESNDYITDLAQSSPIVFDIPVVESQIGRAAWREFFLKLNKSQENKFIWHRIFFSIKSLIRKCIR